MIFVGVDLAWSSRNGTAVTILKGDKNKAEFVCSNDKLMSDMDIINFIDGFVKERNAFVAIDAPLIVPNEKGRRVAEVLDGYLFRKYNAGAHPANRERLSKWDGYIRGEMISRLLEKKGFKHNPYIKRFEKKRYFFEVYPHPSMVVLFNLDKIIRYKSKPKRDYAFRWGEFKRYQNYLRKLEKNNPKLFLPDDIVKKNVNGLKGKKLKEYEDLLDSIFCAYIGYYCWVHPDRCAVLGDMRKGYILTPVFDFMKEKLKSFNNQKKILDF